VVQAGYGAYRRVQAETASPAQLVLLLYDGLLKRLQTALQGLEGHDYEQANGSLQHAQDILLELAASLDMEAGEIAERLAQLYEYQHHLLLQANVRKDPAPVREVVTLASRLRDAWAHAAAQVAWPSQPTQTQPEGGQHG
jgi:flagellar protein FliS